jgi:hypothetical protein
MSQHTPKRVCADREHIMFTKCTIALAIFMAVSSGAFGATKKPPGPTPPGSVHYSHAPQAWHNPNFAGTWDPYGVRWD